VWNFTGAVSPSLLAGSRLRVLLDLDPGIYQLSASEWDMGLDEHDVFLTVGTKLGDPDCEVPDAGVRWKTFKPCVHLPGWPVPPRPPDGAPFTSVVHWSWGSSFEHEGRTLLESKRVAFLRHAALPLLTKRRFQLATHIDPDGDLGDIQVLRSHGWELVEPATVAGDMASYRGYIERSRAEIGCVQEVYAALRTGWMSDRSVCYLASERPVVLEETGVSDVVATGAGMLTFESIEGAAEAVARVDRDYDRHARAARRLAEEHFSAETCLPQMIDACNTTERGARAEG
ncbi:MAG TPA: hypothetical protein VKB17_09180, partial [Thermoleophilaceae bacterium]|nr:hypothetical protein [Thermoleophilaceae bacterium]